MFRLVCTALSACIAVAAVAGGAMAQGRAPDGAIQKVAAGGSAEITKLSTVMKSKVLIQEDESAGQIVDIVLSDAGCVDYVVASYDDQYYAIPFSAVSLRTADRAIFVDITPAQFRKVSFFSANEWPDFYARSFQQNVFATFDVDVIRHDGPHRTAKPDLDRRDDARDRRDDARDRDDRRDDARDRDDRRDTRGTRSDSKDDRRGRDGTAGEKGTETPRDRDPKGKDTAPDRKPDSKPDLKGLTPPKPPGDSKPQPKSEQPKSEQPKSEKPKSKPIAPSPSQPQPKEKKNP